MWKILLGKHHPSRFHINIIFLVDVVKSASKWISFPPTKILSIATCTNRPCLLYDKWQHFEYVIAYKDLQANLQLLFGRNCRCDRILWKGEGLKQLCYVRGESRFSDHRPVYSFFSVQVNSANKPKPRTINPKSCPLKVSTNSALSSSCVAKVQAEELLIFPGPQSYTDKTHSFWRENPHSAIVKLQLWDSLVTRHKHRDKHCPCLFLAVWDGMSGG